MTTDIPEDVRLHVAESEVGTIKVEVEAGREGAVCPPMLELHERVDVGVADETRSKRWVRGTLSTRWLIIRLSSAVM